MRIERDLLELMVWTGMVMTRTMTRATGILLERLFVAATWIALLATGVVMAIRRGGLPWTAPTDPRATSRSTDSRARRTLLR
jgi:hypothetical protein